MIYHYQPGAAQLQQRTGTYKAQDGSGEVRAWACGGVKFAFMQCTTHLATSATAANQCKELMGSVLTEAWADGNKEPTVVSGDLNMSNGGSPDVQACVPAGWYRKGDNSFGVTGVQHEMAQDSFEFKSRATVSMYYTDHPSLVVDYIRPSVTPDYDTNDNRLDPGEQLVSGPASRFPQDTCSFDSTNTSVDHTYFEVFLCAYGKFEIRQWTPTIPGACVWRVSDPAFVSGTSNPDSHALTMQSGGDLTYTNVTTGRLVWHSNTGGHYNAHAELSDLQGNFKVVAPDGTVLWRSIDEARPC